MKHVAELGRTGTPQPTVVRSTFPAVEQALGLHLMVPFDHSATDHLCLFQLYDLEVLERGQYDGTITAGCPKELGCDSCEGNSTCIGRFGSGAGQCICDPGYSGSDCMEGT